MHSPSLRDWRRFVADGRLSTTSTYHDSQPYGATIADNEDVGRIPVGLPGEASASYPFMAYFEVLARYAVGFDVSALELIRGGWGWMLGHGPRDDVGDDRRRRLGSARGRTRRTTTAGRAAPLRH